MQDDEPDACDAVLRRIGRNIVNFQRLEASLKAFIPVMNASGTADSFQTNLAARTKRLKKQSLGPVTTTFVSRLFDDQSQSGSQTVASLPHITYSFTIETGSSAMQERKRALVSLVKERNRLVHTQLNDINFGAPEDCLRLSALLDEQNTRICEQLEFISQVSEAHRSAIEDFERFIQSGEFLVALGSQTSDS